MNNRILVVPSTTEGMRRIPTHVWVDEDDGMREASALVLDTGVLVGAFDRSDDDHVACAKLLAETRERRVVPSPVLVEVDYFLEPGSEGSIPSGGVCLCESPR